jgi:RNA polymerase sigma-70 factor (ECF subfamily)
VDRIGRDGLSDEELISAVRAGDTQSLGVLVARWEEPLFRFVRHLLPRSEDARDVCQETFLRVLKKSDRFRDGSRFSTWMYQIALNLCRDDRRRRRRWSRILAEPAGDRAERVLASVAAVDDPSLPIALDERSDAVRAALAALPREQREVVVLKEYGGLKFREIASILDCPESTVKSRMYYGLNGMRQLLESRGITEA